MTTLTATVQGSTPPKVQITATGIVGVTVTLYREVEGERTVVRGAIDAVPVGSAMVWTDHGAPFGVPVVYVLAESSVEGVITETTSNAVTLLAELPWITNPITGEGVTLTIETWPERTYASRRSLIDVSGRAAPIVISDVRSTASAPMVVITRTREQLTALRELLASGDVLQVRPVCPAVETEFVAIGDAVEARIKEVSRKGDPNPAGSDWRRRWQLDVQVVEQPAPQIPARGDSLLDLHNYVPTTLADLANAFGANATLLDIATTDLGGEPPQPPQDEARMYGEGIYGEGIYGS